MATRDRIKRFLNQQQDTVVPVIPGSKADLFLKPALKKELDKNTDIVQPLILVPFNGTSSYGSGKGSEENVKKPEDSEDRPKLEDIEIIEPPVAMVDANGLPYWEYTVYVKNTSTKKAVDVDILRAKTGTSI